MRDYMRLVTGVILGGYMQENISRISPPHITGKDIGMSVFIRRGNGR